MSADWTTYTRHQLEHGSLRHFKQLFNLLKALKHRFVITNRFRHAASQAVAQCMVDVELARGSRGQEGIVQAYSELAMKTWANKN